MESLSYTLGIYASFYGVWDKSYAVDKIIDDGSSPPGAGCHIVLE